MKRMNAFKRDIYKDCRKAMSPAVIFYSISDIFSGILTIYAAGTLGYFTDAVFDLNFSYGLLNLRKLLVSIGISLIIVPVIGMFGEGLMFINALKHDRMVYGRFLDKTYESAMKIDEGEIQYRLEQDTIDFRVYWVELWGKVLTVPLILLYLLYNALQISLVFTLVAFSISLIKLIIPITMKNVQKKYDERVRAYNSSVRAFETEITKQPYIIKIFGLSYSLIGRLDSCYKSYYKEVFRKNLKLDILSNNILSFLDTFCILAILFTGAVMVSNESITTGAVAAMVGYFSMFNTLMSNIDYIIRKIPVLCNLTNRIKVLYDDAEVLTGSEIEKATIIEARDISFCFEGKIIFNNLSFSINKGEKTAVTGDNGSGKSTLVKLLCGLLKEYSGSLKINGCELNELSGEKWRRQFAYVDQEPFLFEGSVKENILLGNPDADDDSVIQIIQQLNIGYLVDRIIEANDKGLSGGEKQRISIARALLKNTDFVFMDEPDNSLDKNSIAWLMDFISKSDKTIIYVTHDRNMVDSGCVIEL